jgi:hypothetical protein
MVTSRIHFTWQQRAELWERWRNGQSTAAISRALERRNKTGVERIVVLHGGIAPALRQRTRIALRLEEREEISRGIAVGRSIRQIASDGRHRRSAGRLGAMAAAKAIVQIAPTEVPGNGRCAPSLVVWRCTESYDGA